MGLLQSVTLAANTGVFLQNVMIITENCLSGRIMASQQGEKSCYVNYSPLQAVRC